MNKWVIIAGAAVALAVGVALFLLWPSSAAADDASALAPGSDGGPTGRRRSGGASTEASTEDLSDITWDGTDDGLELIA